VVAFAKYCPTCQESKADFKYQAWADAHPDVQVVGLTCDDPTTAWLWAHRHGWTFPVLANGGTVLSGGYADYTACFDKVYKPLGMTWWGDVHSPANGVDTYAFEQAVGF
jgi:peroxiredoxin